MNFRDYLRQLRLNEDEGIKITHLTHLEDLIFTNGIQGAQKTLDFLKTIYNDVNQHRSLLVQQKVDGAPSVIAGTNPENGKFFVATKSLFNKDPKINYTIEDIERNHGHAPGLAKKLKLALKYFPKTIKNGILQGDFMFDADDLEYTTIDGIKGVGFQPNTIYFFVPKDTELYNKIQSSKVGIIWHTVYSGNTISSLSASFSISNNHIKSTADAYVRTPMIQIDQAAWDSHESKKILKDISNLENDLSQINKSYLEEILSNNELISLIQVYMNNKVKNDLRMQKNEIKELIDFIRVKYQEQIDKLKTPSSKEKKLLNLKVIIEHLQKNASTLYHLFEWVYYVEDVKNVIINKLNKLQFPESPYIKQNNGSFMVTDPEGFVVSDGPNNVKFVNRSIFSKQNFLNQKFK